MSYLHGAWIDVSQDEWKMWAAIEAMLAASPVTDAEEYAVHDYEVFEGIRISESTSLADYMQEVTEVSLTIPTALQYYIDWEAMANDAELNGDVFTIRTAFDEVHVFAG